MSAAHDDHAGHGGDDHGHGGHSPWIQHHYDDAQHQFDSGKLGIWLFLAQEVLFFSALFVAYVLYRHHHPEIYAYAHKYLDVKFGAINTAVLIFSSLTAAWAVRAAQLRQRKLLIACLAVTLLCAMTFLAIKYIEYTHKIHEGLLPGEHFDPCVAADGSSLVSKKNECPGSKGSVVWSFEKKQPETGCFPVFSLDQKPLQAGVQADCTVAELAFTQLTDNKGEPIINPDTKGSLFVNPGPATPIAKQCEPSHGEGEHDAHGEPCWKTSHQPAVCRPGWFFAMRCTNGPGMEKLEAELTAVQRVFSTTPKKVDEITNAELAKAKKTLNAVWVASRCDKTEQYSVSQWFGTRSDCNSGRSKREKELKKIVDEEGEAQCPKAKPTGDTAQDNALTQKRDTCIAAIRATLTRYEVNECVHSEQVGVVVEHHDHTVIPNTIAVAASCKPPVKPGPEGDVFADKSRTLEVGAKAAGTAEPVHDAHGELYAGAPPEHTGMFFTIYFAMTGLHGIHVLVGVFVFIWLLIRAIKGHFSPEYFGPVDWAALYWHIVDLIWIFLFPLMYLIH